MSIILDVSKPISTATSDALLLKRRSVKQEYTNVLSNSDEKYPSERATKTYIDAVASGVVDASFNRKREAELAGDIGGTADVPTVPGLLLKEPLIAQGQMTDYYRGDKSFNH
jgi:hypothetical protein